jgi:hypothetical protein
VSLTMSLQAGRIRKMHDEERVVQVDVLIVAEHIKHWDPLVKCHIAAGVTQKCTFMI